MCNEEKRLRIVKKWMLARYYVYEQHVGEEENRHASPGKPRKGIRKLELVEKKRGDRTGKLRALES